MPSRPLSFSLPSFKRWSTAPTTSATEGEPGSAAPPRRSSSFSPDSRPESSAESNRRETPSKPRWVELNLLPRSRQSRDTQIYAENKKSDKRRSKLIAQVKEEAELNKHDKTKPDRRETWHAYYMERKQSQQHRNSGSEWGTVAEGNTGYSRCDNPTVAPGEDKDDGVTAAGHNLPTAKFGAPSTEARTTYNVDSGYREASRASASSQPPPGDKGAPTSTSKVLGRRQARRSSGLPRSLSVQTERFNRTPTIPDTTMRTQDSHSGQLSSLSGNLSPETLPQTSTPADSTTTTQDPHSNQLSSGNLSPESLPQGPTLANTTMTTQGSHLSQRKSLVGKPPAEAKRPPKGPIRLPLPRGSLGTTMTSQGGENNPQKLYMDAARKARHANGLTNSASTAESPSS